MEGHSGGGGAGLKTSHFFFIISEQGRIFERLSGKIGCRSFLFLGLFYFFVRSRLCLLAEIQKRLA